MTLNRLINMLIRRFSNKAINSGINYAARKGKDPATMTDAERQQARSASKHAKNARKTMRLSRKIGRF